MAKPSYRWRYSLDASRLDVTIALRSDSGVGTRPLSVRFILSVVVFIVVGLWIGSAINQMGTGWVVLFVFFWLIAGAVMLRPGKDGHLAYEQVPTLLNYLPRSSRHVLTRSTSSAWQARSIIGIDDIDADTGLISLSDGGFAYMYRVTGSASVLLFADDRDSIINRADAFWRNMRSDYEMIFITLRESQQVTRQLRAMDKRIAWMRQVPEMSDALALAVSERDVLAEYVGRDLKSIHQYMILRADSVEALDAARAVLDVECSNSTLMFKHVTALFDDDLLRPLQSVFGAVRRNGKVGA